MPYQTNDDLPETVRKALAGHALEVWRAAFNSALEQYGDEGAAARVAWEAVGRLYEKEDGKWRRRQGNRAADLSLGEITVAEADPEDPDLSRLGDFASGEIMKFEGILARAETNKNMDDIDEKGIREICETLPLMPVDDEHIQSKVVGIFVEATPQSDAAHVTGVIYARRFPEEAKAVAKGEKKLSVEARAQYAQCSICGETFEREEDYCTCLKRRLYGSGAVRKLSGLKAVGGAITRTPAGTDTEIDRQSILMVASELAVEGVKKREDVKERARSEVLGGHTGVAIMLYLPLEAAQKLAIEGGEKPEDLHLTLVYLGDRAEEGSIVQVQTAIEAVAAHHGPIKGAVSGIGRFSDGGVIYASFDAPDLPGLRQAIVDALEQAEVPISQEHGFTPHITLAYVEEGEDSPVSQIDHLEIELDTITLGDGDEHHLFPLRGQMTEGDQTPIVRMEAKDGETLAQRYERFLAQAIQVMHFYYPGFPEEVEARLPRNLGELAQMAGPDAKATYAIALPKEGAIIFSPEHQQGMELFDGSLTPTHLWEIRVAKTILHELLHHSVNHDQNEWKEEVDALLGESLIELQAAWHVANNIEAEGERDQLVESVGYEIIYPNRFPWIVEIAILVAGEEAPRWVQETMSLPPAETTEKVIEALGEMGISREGAIEYILQPPMETRSTEIDERIKGKAAQVGGENPFIWYMNSPLTRKENDMGKGTKVTATEQRMCTWDGTQWAPVDEAGVEGKNPLRTLFVVQKSEGDLAANEGKPLRTLFVVQKADENSDMEVTDEEGKPLRTLFVVQKAGDLVATDEEGKPLRTLFVVQKSSDSSDLGALQAKIKETLDKLSGAEGATTEARAQVQTAEAKAQKLTTRVQELEASLKTVSQRERDLVTATRVRELAEILGEEKAQAKREAVKDLSDAGWNLLLASTREAAEIKPGSIKGGFDLGDPENKSGGGKITTLANVFGA